MSVEGPAGKPIVYRWLKWLTTRFLYYITQSACPNSMETRFGIAAVAGTIRINAGRREILEKLKACKGHFIALPARV